MDTRYLVAIEFSDTYRPEDVDETDRNRVGMKSGAAPEHAFVDDATICGIPRTKVYVMRHYWRSSDKRACHNCKAAFIPLFEDGPSDGGGADGDP